MAHPKPSLSLFASSIAIALVGSTPSGELPTYTGAGFQGPTATQLAASHIEMMDLDGDGLQDLIALESDGAITANLDLASRSHWLRLAGFEAMAVTRTGGERLWAVTAGKLVEVRLSDLEGTTSPASTGDLLPGVRSLAAQDRPGGARLVCVNAYGLRAAAYGLSGGSWGLLNERFAAGEQGVFHDAALVDWDGGGADWFAAVSDVGLHVYDPSGAELVSLGGDPTGAFLDVIPAVMNPWGHDLLAYHHRSTPTDPHLIWFANAFHGEIQYAQNTAVRGFVMADFLPAPGAELIVATGSARDVWILRQAPGATEQAPLFTLDLGDVFLIDIDQGAGTAISVAPAGAAADIDGDGDQDLVFLDDLGRKVVLPSQTFDEDLLRASIDMEESNPVIAGGALS